MSKEGRHYIFGVTLLGQSAADAGFSCAFRGDEPPLTRVSRFDGEGIGHAISYGEEVSPLRALPHAALPTFPPRAAIIASLLYLFSFSFHRLFQTFPISLDASRGEAKAIRLHDAAMR